MQTDFRDTVFATKAKDFHGLAIEIFRYQYRFNELYRQFSDALGIAIDQVKAIHQIPFLPVEFFKNFQVSTTEFQPQMIFESSGTTRTRPSLHFVRDLELYKKSFRLGFESFYGPVDEWCIIAVLPSYLERKNSSLVLMVHELIGLSRDSHSGFYLDDYAALAATLMKMEQIGKKTLLIGVSFALVDFASQFPMQLKHTTIMETGGMKGRKREMTRAELHAFLMKQFGLSSIHSEYGMTELLSQAYSDENGIFRPVPWMRMMIRTEDDPLDVREMGEGIINIIDLANIYSCAFIATDDMGKIFPDGRFEIAGRLDHSDLRGCSLMVF